MRLRLGACALALVVAAPAAAERLTDEEREFVARWSDEALVVLGEEHRLDVRHEQEGSGVEGRWTWTIDYLVQDRAAIETVSRQVRVRGPVFESTDFEVEIFHASGDKSRFREEFFQWVQVPGGADGVYTRDQVLEYAVVPRIAVGDRVRVHETYAIRGTHGIPALQLGMLEDVPVLRSTAEIVHPRDHELVTELVGRPELVERVRLTRRDAGTRWAEEVVLEDYVPEAGAWRSPFQHGFGVRWVGHFAVAGERGGAASLASGATWAETGAAYLEMAEEKILPDTTLTAEARGVVGDAGSEEEKVRLLYEYVQRECRYLGLFDGLGGLIPEPAAVTAERRYGDCKGLSVYLLALLRSVGIEAWPALVRTAGQGPFATSVPNLTQFNHFIVFARVGGKNMWLDPVYDYCPAGLVPLQDAGNPVLKLEPGRIGLVELSPEDAPAGDYVYTLEGELRPDGTGDFQLLEQATGNAALRRRLWREGEDDDELLDGVLEDLGSAALRGGRIAARFEERPAFDEPWELSLDLHDVSAGTLAADRLFLPLRLLDFFLLSFDADDRTEPFQLRGAPAVSVRWRLDVPGGWTLAPVAHERTGPGMRWELRASLEEGVLELNREIRFEPLTLSADEARELDGVLEEIGTIEEGYLELRRAGAGR